MCSSDLLHRRLVRTERLAQDVSFFSMGFVGGASITAGWATVRPGVDPAAVEAAYWEELERLTREPVTDDELQRAKALIESDELGALQRTDERADRLSMYATLFDDPDLVNRMLGRYLSITAGQIRAVAAEVLRADNRVVLTYLPKGPVPADAEAGAEGPPPGPEGDVEETGDEETAA